MEIDDTSFCCVKNVGFWFCFHRLVASLRRHTAWLKLLQHLINVQKKLFLIERRSTRYNRLILYSRKLLNTCIQIINMLICYKYRIFYRSIRCFHRNFHIFIFFPGLVFIILYYTWRIIHQLLQKVIQIMQQTQCIQPKIDQYSYQSRFYLSCSKPLHGK